MTSTQSTPVSTNDRIKVISQKEYREILDELARQYVNMSGDEFIEAWESGEFDNQREFPGLMEMVMMIPLTR